MKRFTSILLFLLLLATYSTFAQERRDQAVFAVKNDAMYDAIKKALAESEGEKSAAKVFQVDFSTIPAPAMGDFTSQWHLPPILQGRSGMCWCFSATSLLESEIYRLSNRKIKLSELHTVYWEHVEKARGFVKSRGTSLYGEGSEANAVLRIWKKYGAVPAASYTGLQPGVRYHNHSALFSEIENYLNSIKEANAWNEEVVIATVRTILDHHIGSPPETVIVDGASLTPKEYLAKVVRLNPDDYVDLLSLMQQPFYEKVEYPVPDNWWHNSDYYNVPLQEFMQALKKAIRDGYTISIGGDMSEAGYSFGAAGMAVVPSFDIPSSYIDDLARQFRFSNKTTQDDHFLHLVGYVAKDGKDWYLVKDSWSSAYNSSHPGYYFYHEDYVKLKMLCATLHKDAVRDLLARFK